MSLRELGYHHLVHGRVRGFDVGGVAFAGLVARMGGTRILAWLAAGMGRENSMKAEEQSESFGRTALWVLLSGVAYYLATKIAWSLCISESKVSLLFPPHAVLVSVLLLARTRHWWAYILAAICGHLVAAHQAHWPLLFTLESEAFDAVQNVPVAAGIRLFIKSPFNSLTLRDAIVFVLIAVIVVPFGTAFWGAAFTLSNHFGTHYWVEWRKLGMANGVTAIVLVPAILVGISRLSAGWTKVAPGRLLEAGLLGVGILTIGALAFDSLPAGPDTSPGLLYAPVPLFIWAALRFGLGGMSASMLVIACQAIWGAMRGHGPFLTQTPAENALSLQTFLVVTATPLMFLAVGVEEEKRSQRALRDSEQRMSLAANAARLRHWEWDMVAGNLWAADRTRIHSGPAQSERGGFNEFLQSLHPDDREPVSHAVAKSMNGDGEYECEYRVPLPGGATHWMVSRGRTEFNSAGRPVRIRGVSIDITERKRAEEALRESEARFRSVADTAPVLIWMSGTDKLCNFFNQGWLDFTGRALERELGDGWAEGVHPDDLPHCLKTYVESFDARRPFTMEYRLRRHDGEYRWVSDNAVPRYGPDGNFLGYIGSCVDLTESKLAEEKFRLVVEASPNGIVLVNREGRMVLVNTETERVFGYRREELIGHIVEMLVPERFRGAFPGYRKGFFAAPRARAMGAGHELFALRKDGTEFPVEIGFSPIQSAEGTLVLVVIVDITARKLALAEALRQRVELAHVARVSTMGALASSLAHELNQPLSAILSNAQAASRFMSAATPDLTEVRGALEDIADATKRAGQVIRQMRALVRKDEPQMEPLNLNRLIPDVARLLHSDMLIRKVRLALELEPSLRMTSGDNVQLQQVLLNLVLNAFDAMKDVPEDGRTVILRTLQPEADLIRVEVSDCGTGISPERLSNLFEPFLSSKRDGLGLGLSISHSIIQAHMGRIWAENNPARGATFYFTLPVCEPGLNLS
jgi:two-component system sensor kinase FixL